MYFFSVYATIFKKSIFGHEIIKKTDLKRSILMTFFIFFSAASTAQNRPEMNIRFIDSYIQWFEYYIWGCGVSFYSIQNQAGFWLKAMFQGDLEILFEMEECFAPF